MPIYLYKKTHRKTGLKYLGKTSQDPYQYLGSGIIWTRHLKKYGNDVSTEILQECSNNEEVKFWGIYYSKLWNVVESKEWANLKFETGDGGDTSMCENYKIGIKNRNLSGPNNPNWRGFTDRHRANLSASKKGIKPKNYEKWVRAAKGTSYYNNGSIEKRFVPNDIPAGWTKGRLKIKCVCGKQIDISNLKKYHSTCVNEPTIPPMGSKSTEDLLICLLL